VGMEEAQELEMKVSRWIKRLARLILVQSECIDESLYKLLCKFCELWDGCDSRK